MKQEGREAKIQFCEFLNQCYDGLNTYGKTPEQLENLTGLFLEVLGGYPFKAVKNAFLEHIKRSPNLPTPADIINIIDPPKCPLSAAVYVNLQKRAADGGWLLSDERAYCRAFEEQEKAKVRGGSDELRDCIHEIENYKLQQIEVWKDNP